MPEPLQSLIIQIDVGQFDLIFRQRIEVHQQSRDSGL